eukprot:5416718-Pyramimonas_sp.AAC.1
MEHPAPAEHRPNAPSSWHLPILSKSARQLGVKLHRIDQCMFGLSAKKPTSLMGVHIPMLNQLINELPHQGRCQHSAHVQVLQGRDASGAWQTARAKTYPSE